MPLAPKPNIHLICAARPNFMKVAPLYHVLSAQDWGQPVLIHTGQHYDANMSDAFFKDLNLPDPDHHLEVSGGSNTGQTARTMLAYEALCEAERPDMCIVVGDVNATSACAQVAAHKQIPVGHIEAGLRSFDRTMPEEINRILTDGICDILWTHSPEAETNLTREGIAPNKIRPVGNIMMDALESKRASFSDPATFAQFGQEAGKYMAVTLHRPSNVDDKSTLKTLVDLLIQISKTIPLVFPVHPRTAKNLDSFGLTDALEKAENITTTTPVGYQDFMCLIHHSAGLITDSGGVQEETSYLNIPCLTLRDNTERPVTVDLGTNELILKEAYHTLPDKVAQILAGQWKQTQNIPLWDGKTAERITEDIKAFVTAKNS